MAISGSFAPRPEPQISQTNTDVPWIYVLSVLISEGGFAKQRVIATAENKDDIKKFLETWVSANRQHYAGRYQIDYVPFVTEVDDA
jgi:hypothetical protein